jgi:hypothetical protein
MPHQPTVRLLLAAGFALATPSLAQQPQPHERFGQPPAPARPHRVSPPYAGPADLPPSIQVNTNAQGLNIVGDAANEPSMTVDPTAPNRIAIGWRQFDSISSNFRKAGAAYSRDGGRTWSSAGPLDPATFRTDPVLDTTADGTFYYYSLYGTALLNCDLFRSTSHGQYWSVPVPALGGDKNWMAIDRTFGIGHNHIYIVWSPFYSCCGPAIFARSIDLGATFQQPLAVPGRPYWATIAVGAEGEVYAAGLSADNPSSCTFSRSTNARNPAILPAAISWDLTRPINLGGIPRANTGTGPNPGGLNGQVWVAADHSSGPTRGNIYMLSTVDPPGTDPGDCMLVRSTDGGNTWSAPIRINTDAQTANGWQWMGTIAIAPTGRIDAVWVDTRESQQASLGRLYYSYSSDAGQTWSANEPITPQWNSFVGWPQQSKIGDYYQLVSDRVGAHLIYAATLNGEQDLFYMRLGDYDCNGNGVGDAQDLAAGTLHDCDQDGIPDQCELAAGTPVNCVCYANCDQSTALPVLNVGDFTCFLQRFAAGDSYANCDSSTILPVLNVGDFTCFLQRFAAGCP